jgi:hypothetical protein
MWWEFNERCRHQFALCSLISDASGFVTIYVGSVGREKSEGADMENIYTPNRRVDFPSPQTTNPWSAMLLEKLIVVTWSRNSPYVMEP